MRIGAWLLAVELLASACGGDATLPGAKQASSSSLGGSADDSLVAADSGASPSVGKCNWPTSLDGAGPGACGVASALVNCTGDSGGCSCLSDDPTKCAGCAEQFPGPLTCENQCAANEYAVSCGGPPRLDGTTYQAVPADCRFVFGGPGGGVSACCPCQ